MPDALDLAITGLGAVTPVGLGAPTTCAALRAGVARIGEVNTMLVEGELLAGVPAAGGRVPTEWFDRGPEEWEWPGHEAFEVEPPPAPETLVAPGVDWLIELAVPAAREALAAAGIEGATPEGFGVFLGLSEHEDADALRTRIADAIAVESTRVIAVEAGRAAFFLALRAAAKELLAGRLVTALVGGVDSLIRRESLERLTASGALRSQTRPEGILPGEAAAFVVLERASAAAARDVARSRLEGIVRTEEPTAGTDAINRAEGLTLALRKLRANTPPLDEPPHVVCDLNGDRYRASEWALASMRAFADLHGDHGLWHPADCVGDTGAASGALALVWAATALRQGYALTERVVVWGASDGPARAAALLSTDPPA